MDEFWNNVVRYPRFLISSLVGLILIILAPFRNLLKLKKFRIIFLILLCILILILSKILQNMTGL